jgi:hypothetical protein
VLSGALAIILVGVGLAARPAAATSADPPGEAARQAWLVATADAADAALARLQVEIEAAVDSARRGAASIVSGEDPPGPPLIEGAAVLEAARDEVAQAAAATARLRGTLACARPDAAGLAGDGAVPTEVVSIAVQLRASASAAEPFAERRWAADATLAALSDALAALDGDDPEGALAALDDADAALELVAAWDEPPPSLGYWLATTGELLGAARAIADATLAADPAAAAAAAAAYRAAAATARDADRALALAIAEAGSALAVVPMRRLADALAELIALRADIAAIAGAAVGRGHRSILA